MLETDSQPELKDDNRYTSDSTMEDIIASLQKPECPSEMVKVTPIGITIHIRGMPEDAFPQTREELDAPMEQPRFKAELA